MARSVNAVRAQMPVASWPPGRFLRELPALLWDSLVGFRRNQGRLLAGAVAFTVLENAMSVIFFHRVQMLAIFLLLGAQVIATYERRPSGAFAPSSDPPPLADNAARV